MNPLTELAESIEGEVRQDPDIRYIYSTDASIYREVPSAVAFPKNSADLRKITEWSFKNKVPVIPRTAGTSLAGQVVGKGVIVDVARYLNRIIEINPEEKFVWVEPGVIRDDLNRVLKTHNLFFAPETSTSNRCMTGGMTGNNSCGANSLIYGSVRDHLLEVEGYLSDGTPFHAFPVDEETLNIKILEDSREGEIYRFICDNLMSPSVQEQIDNVFPWKEIRRRNTGYALDTLLDMKPFKPDGERLNLSPIIAGSEGTLMMISALKLNLVPLISRERVLLCSHFRSLDEALEANLKILQYPVGSIELIDKTIIECIASHPGLKNHSSFIQGKPEGVLLVEIFGEFKKKSEEITKSIVEDLESANLGYHHLVLSGNEIRKVMELRKAGLGLLANMKGDRKPVTFIEDAAVRSIDILSYIREIRAMLQGHDLSAAYYGHVGTGEIHIKPFMDLSKPEHRDLLREVSLQTALLVKKYRGSLSGEHGDGRLRGEFIPLLYGKQIYDLFKGLKAAFDPEGLLNPGKITDAPPVNTSLKFLDGFSIPGFKPAFNYNSDGGFFKALERCSGSGDCRRPFWHEAIMCPSYQATNDEYFSTRGRINLIKEILIRQTDKPFSDKSLKRVLDSCLSCKGCRSECPGAVDMARYKAEILHQYHRYHNRTSGEKLVINIYNTNRLFGNIPKVYNALLSINPVASLVKHLAGIHPRRELPKLSSPTLETWIKRNKESMLPIVPMNAGKLIFFVDEFTNHYDAEVGIKAIKLLHILGYEIIPYMYSQSGRALISKGSLDKARKIANKNIINLKNLGAAEIPFIGIEPSTILTFSDEYPDLVSPDRGKDAGIIASNTFLIEEFLVKEYEKGAFSSDLFTGKKQKVLFHGHCHQKSLRRSDALRKILSIPAGYEPEEINSGCCGMAGSFGMEKDHYQLSMKIGELILFPRLREISDGTIVAVPGTSCRSQILHGTGIKALHPLEILFNALIDKI